MPRTRLNGRTRRRRKKKQRPIDPVFVKLPPTQRPGSLAVRQICSDPGVGALLNHIVRSEGCSFTRLTDKRCRVYGQWKSNSPPTTDAGPTITLCRQSHKALGMLFWDSICGSQFVFEVEYHVENLDSDDQNKLFRPFREVLAIPNRLSADGHMCFDLTSVFFGSNENPNIDDIDFEKLRTRFNAAVDYLHDELEILERSISVRLCLDDGMRPVRLHCSNDDYGDDIPLTGCVPGPKPVTFGPVTCCRCGKECGHIIKSATARPHCGECLNVPMALDQIFVRLHGDEKESVEARDDKNEIADEQEEEKEEKELYVRQSDGVAPKAVYESSSSDAYSTAFVRGNWWSSSDVTGCLDLVVEETLLSFLPPQTHSSKVCVDLRAISRTPCCGLSTQSGLPHRPIGGDHVMLRAASAMIYDVDKNWNMSLRPELPVIPSTDQYGALFRPRRCEIKSITFEYAKLIRVPLQPMAAREESKLSIATATIWNLHRGKATVQTIWAIATLELPLRISEGNLMLNMNGCPKIEALVMEIIAGRVSWPLSKWASVWKSLQSKGRRVGFHIDLRYLRQHLGETVRVPGSYAMRVVAGQNGGQKPVLSLTVYAPYHRSSSSQPEQNHVYVQYVSRYSDPQIQPILRQFIVERSPGYYTDNSSDDVGLRAARLMENWNATAVYNLKRSNRRGLGLSEQCWPSEFIKTLFIKLKASEVIPGARLCRSSDVPIGAHCSTMSHNNVYKLPIDCYRECWRTYMFGTTSWLVLTDLMKLECIFASPERVSPVDWRLLCGFCFVQRFKEELVNCSERLIVSIGKALDPTCSQMRLPQLVCHVRALVTNMIFEPITESCDCVCSDCISPHEQPMLPSTSEATSAGDPQPTPPSVSAIDGAVHTQPRNGNSASISELKVRNIVRHRVFVESPESDHEMSSSFMDLVSPSPMNLDDDAQCHDDSSSKLMVPSSSSSSNRKVVHRAKSESSVSCTKRTRRQVTPVTTDESSEDSGNAPEWDQRGETAVLVRSRNWVQSHGVNTESGPIHCYVVRRKEGSLHDLAINWTTDSQKKFDEEKWLFDDPISVFAIYMTDMMPRSIRAKVYFFQPSQWYQAVEGKEDKIIKYLQNLPRSFADSKYLFFPMNKNNGHWQLGVIHNIGALRSTVSGENVDLFMLDSLTRTVRLEPHQSRVFRRWMLLFHQVFSPRPLTDLKYNAVREHSVSGPQQHDTDSCSLFMMMAMKKIALAADIADINFNGDHIDMRELFTKDEALALRPQIRSWVEELADDQRFALERPIPPLKPSRRSDASPHSEGSESEQKSPHVHERRSSDTHRSHDDGTTARRRTYGSEPTSSSSVNHGSRTRPTTRHNRSRGRRSRRGRPNWRRSRRNEYRSPRRFDRSRERRSRRDATAASGGSHSIQHRQRPRASYRSRRRQPSAHSARLHRPQRSRTWRRKSSHEQAQHCADRMVTPDTPASLIESAEDSVAESWHDF